MSIRNRRSFAGSASSDRVGGDLVFVPKVPSVEIFPPAEELVFSDPQQFEWDIILKWNENVEFAIHAVSVTGCTFVSITNIEGDTYVVRVRLPVSSTGVAEITIPANSVKGSESLGPAQDIKAGFSYGTGAAAATVSGPLCRLSLNTNYFANTLDIRDAAFTNIMDISKLGSFIYFLVEIQNRDSVSYAQSSDRPRRDLVRNKQGAAALYRVDTTSCTFTLIKLYKSVTLAPRSIVLHDNRVEMFEGSHYAYLNEGLAYTDISSSEDNFQHFIRRLDGVDPDWKNQIGSIKSINNSETELTNHGINWISADPTENPAYDGSDPTNISEDSKLVVIDGIYYTLDSSKEKTQITKIDEPPDKYYGIHGGTASPMLSVGDDLYFISGYGNLMRSVDFRNDAKDLNASDVARYDNWHQIKRGKIHDFRHYDLRTNGKTYHDVFTEFARETYSTFGFINDKFYFRPRDPRYVIVNQLELPAADTSRFIFDDGNYANDSYSTSSTIAINKEVLSYTGFDTTNKFVTGLTRGLYNTTAADHHQDDRAYWIDHVIQLNSDTLEQIISKVDKNNDIDNIKNYITIEYGNPIPYVATDDASIERYGKRELTIQTSINRNEIARVKWLADNLLYRYAKLHNVLTVDIGFAPYLEVGQCIFFQCEHRMHLEKPCQILEIEHKLSDKMTIITIVTL